MDALTESFRLHDESLRIRNTTKAGQPDLSLERYRGIVESWNSALGDDPPGPLFKGVVTRHNVCLAATCTAEILHTILQRRHSESDGSTTVAEAEIVFEEVLSLLRTGARSENRTLVALGFETLLTTVADAAVMTPSRVERGGDPGAALDTIRAYHLLHRICSVAAAIPELQFRQMIGRSRSSLARIASRRSTLTMPGLPTEFPVATNISDHAVGDRIALTAFVTDANWVDRPDKPYTALALDSGEELRVHFKNTRRVGMVENKWVWARCKVEEPEEGLHYAVAEFEGPTTSAGECWESWLQVEARPHYDVSPGSMHVFTSNSDKRLDLYSRLASEEETD